MKIEKIDHVILGSSRPTQDLYNSESFQKLLTVFLEKTQELEEQFLQLAEQKDLNLVTGIWLDYIGKIVDEDRAGREDEEYRQALQLKTAINTSDGTPTSIQQIIGTYTESDYTRLFEGRNAWGQLVINGTLNVDSTAWQLLQDIKVADVRMFLAELNEDTGFLPSWEIYKETLKLFQVFTGGVTETLELIITDGAEENNLFINLQGKEVAYAKGTDSRHFLEWEDPLEFNVFDGVTEEPFEFQVTETEVSNYIPAGINSAVKGTVTLPWEINEHSVVTPYGPPQDFQYFNGSTLNDLYVVGGSFGTEVLQVSGVLI
ncbi:hypothetical protein NVP1063O_061 [Vibrio phage 1.063.O._10N.261.45.C7]|nr:hypothetical protein NVP1063O_061 [Vibrio phage 1.063.O._10N.261.45.C7]